MEGIKGERTNDTAITPWIYSALERKGGGRNKELEEGDGQRRRQTEVRPEAYIL